MANPFGSETQIMKVLKLIGISLAVLAVPVLGIVGIGVYKTIQQDKEISEDLAYREQAAKATKPAEAAKPVELELTRGSGLDGHGYEIMTPKGAQVLSNTDMMRVYSLPLPGGLHEYNVALTPEPAKDMEQFTRMVSMIAGSGVVEKSATDGGFLLVTGPELGVQDVYFAKIGKKGGVRAKCGGPTEELALLKKMCLSLSLTSS
jgi:hypothetical protein